MNNNAEQQIDELPSISIKELRSLLISFFGKDCHKFNRKYIERQIAYRLQEIAYGRLKDDVREKLLFLKCKPGNNTLFRTERISEPGTVITSEYQGTEHRVTVLDLGYEYCGRRYSNLSAIANLITGTRWSGPRFFGLKGDQ